MGLSGSLFASQFTYITGSSNPSGAIFRHGFQFTLLNRGQDIRRQPGITIQDALNNNPNTASYRIDGNAPMPQVGEKVEIRDEADNDRRLFGGTVLDVEQVYEGQINQLAFNVTATDFTTLFNKRRPYGTYVNVSVSLIIIDLVSKNAPGFTTAHVQTNLAKVSITLDGSRDFVTVLSDLAQAIGGGHWYIDYDMDVHFFHIVPPGLTVPPTPQPIAVLAHLTVAEGVPNSGASLYAAGYYLFTHSFIYSDGTESALQGVSNMLFASGLNGLSFSNIPLGVTLGTSVCIGRRIYYNDFVSGYTAGEKIEKVNQFCQINDNTTTAFTSQWLEKGASVPTVVHLGYVATFSVSLVPTPGTGTIIWQQLSDQAASINLEGKISNGVYGSPNGSIVQPPASAGTASLGTSLPAGWPTGLNLFYAYTATNANGETTLGPSAQVTLSSSGVVFTAPTPMPTGANNLCLYLSEDGGVTYRRHSAGLFAGQRITFSSPHSFWLTNPAPPTQNTAIIGLYRGWIGYNGLTQLTLSNLLQPNTGGSNNIVYYASQDVAAVLEAAARNRGVQPPVRPVTVHPSGPFDPITGFVEGVQGATFWSGGQFQFKYAYVYRDGTVSFSSKPSPTIEKLRISGEGVKGFSLQSIDVGPQIGNLDVVARFIYFCQGKSTAPNANFSSGNINPATGVPAGTLWPVPDSDPDWTAPWGVIIIPDNTSTSLLQFSLNALGATFTDGTYNGLVCGAGNLPYVNPNDDPLSVDPIPSWPNPDGPNLENTTPPSDITNSNPFLLFDENGGQAFKIKIDGSQLRNRVVVIGSGSVTTLTAAIGDTKLYTADVSAFSPHGGTLKYDDPSTGVFIILGYAGVGGVVGSAYIILAKALDRLVPQGVNIANFYQADDIESQKTMSKVELDAFGKSTDGIHEYTIVDTSLKAMFQLFMRGQAELELFSKPIVQVSYSTRDPTRSGQTVHVDMDNPPCFGDFLVQSVTIDQVHDESDSLTPRYSVTASSVRFELNDLLLQILRGQQSSSGGNSSAGVVAAGGGGSTSGLPKRYSAGWAFYSGSVQTVAVGGSLTISGGTQDTVEIPPWSSVGTSSSNQNDTWITLLTATGVSTVASAILSPGLMLEDRVDAWFEVQTPIVMTNIGLWVGFTDLWTPVPPSGSNISIASLRFAPNSGDQGWTSVMQPAGVGHAQSTSLVAPIAASTKYVIRCQTFVGATFNTAQVMWTINGISKVITYDANMPVAGSYGGPNRLQAGVGVANLNTDGITAVKFNFRRISISMD